MVAAALAARGAEPAGPVAQDQRLHDDTFSRGRWTDRYTFQLNGDAMKLGADFALGPNGRQLSLEGVIGPTGGGGRVGLSMPAPITPTLTLGPTLSIGGGYEQIDSPGGDTHMVNLEGSAGLMLDWRPNPMHHLGLSAVVTARGHIGWDTGAQAREEQRAQTAIADYVEGGQQRVQQLKSDLEGIARGLSADSGQAIQDIIRARLDTFSAALPSLLTNVALAAITPSATDDATAAAALDTAIETLQSGIQSDIRAQLGPQGDAAAEQVRTRIQAFLSEMGAYSRSASRDYREGFENPVENGWGVNAQVRLSYRADIPIWQPDNGGRGGGLYLVPSAVLYGNIPIAGENDRATIPGERDPTVGRVGAQLQLGPRFQIPSTSMNFLLSGGVDVWATLPGFEGGVAPMATVQYYTAF